MSFSAEWSDRPAVTVCVITYNQDHISKRGA